MAKESISIPTNGTDITKLFIKDVASLIPTSSEEHVLMTFANYCRTIMHSPAFSEITIGDMRYVYWTAGRKYHSKNSTFTEDYEMNTTNLFQTLSMYKHHKLFSNFFEYMLKLTKDRSLEASRTNLGLYKDYRRKDFNGDPDSAFAHSISYIKINHYYMVIDFLDIEQFVNGSNTCGAYTISFIY